MPHGKFNVSEAVRFGIERRQPLLVVPADSATPPVESLFTIDPTDAVVQSIKPVHQEAEYLLYLYNPTSSTQKVHLRWTAGVPISIYRSSSFASEDKEMTTGFELHSYDSQYFLVRKK